MFLNPRRELINMNGINLDARCHLIAMRCLIANEGEIVSYCFFLVDIRIAI